MVDAKEKYRLKLINLKTFCQGQGRQLVEILSILFRAWSRAVCKILWGYLSK